MIWPEADDARQASVLLELGRRSTPLCGALALAGLVVALMTALTATERERSRNRSLNARALRYQQGPERRPDDVLADNAQLRELVPKGGPDGKTFLGPPGVVGRRTTAKSSTSTLVRSQRSRLILTTRRATAQWSMSVAGSAVSFPPFQRSAYDGASESTFAIGFGGGDTRRSVCPSGVRRGAADRHERRLLAGLRAHPG